MRLLPGEGGGGHEDDPDSDEQQPAAVDDARKRCIEDDGHGQHDAEGRQRAVAGAVEQREGLARPR